MLHTGITHTHSTAAALHVVDVGGGRPKGLHICCWHQGEARKD